MSILIDSEIRMGESEVPDFFDPEEESPLFLELEEFLGLWLKPEETRPEPVAS